MQPRFDVVMALNYYAPYVSGLTDAARLVAETLVARGRRVAVVTCKHDPSLPGFDVINGVEVIRTPVVARVGKGLISPKFVNTVVKVAKQARVVNLHMPMIESGLIARLLPRTPVVATYQCDVSLPKGLLNGIQSRVMDLSVSHAMRKSDRIVPSSIDYAENSRLRSLMSDERTVAISPPTRLQSGGRPRFRETDALHVGFLGRIVEEKGLEYLVDGFRALDTPDARLLIGGGFGSIAGGSVIDKVRRRIGDDPRIRLLGFVPDDALADFYASLDVFALPSVNAFEAFGIVQVEAMRLGVAALASDLPGVRIPVRQTGFGRIVPPAESAAITAALQDLSTARFDRKNLADRTNRLYSTERTTDEYEKLFVEVGRDY